jgi:hypothetical protein
MECLQEVTVQNRWIQRSRMVETMTMMMTRKRMMMTTPLQTRSLKLEKMESL